MAISPPTTDQVAIQLAIDTEPDGSVSRNADGTIDYFERMILEPRPAAVTRVNVAESPEESATVVTRLPATPALTPAGDLPGRKANLVLAAFQLLVGYAWLVSGVDKLLYGKFPDRISQLIAIALASGRLPGFFAQLAQMVVLPNAPLFGVLVECGETLTGAGILAGAVLTVAGPLLERRASSAGPSPARTAVRWLALPTMIAAMGGTFLGLTFYVMDGLPLPWFSPGIAYGGAIHSGLLLALACLIILIGQMTNRIRRADPVHGSA